LVSLEPILRVSQGAAPVDAVKQLQPAGVWGTTIKAVVAGAGVSRSTFYEVFDDFDACFLAVLDSGVRR
jgi:AcrR family transcriptional regulator